MHGSPFLREVASAMAEEVCLKASQGFEEKAYGF